MDENAASTSRQAPWKEIVLAEFSVMVKHPELERTGDNWLSRVGRFQQHPPPIFQSNRTDATPSLTCSHLHELAPCHIIWSQVWLLNYNLMIWNLCLRSSLHKSNSWRAVIEWEMKWELTNSVFYFLYLLSKHTNYTIVKMCACFSIDKTNHLFKHTY
jgi:hypothetical protein